MPRIERDIRRWLKDEKRFTGHGEPGLVRGILNSFQAVYPQHVEEMEVLEVLARVTGFDGVLKMLGSSVCESDGSRTLTLAPDKAGLAK